MVIEKFWQMVFEYEAFLLIHEVACLKLECCLSNSRLLQIHSGLLLMESQQVTISYNYAWNHFILDFLLKITYCCLFEGLKMLLFLSYYFVLETDANASWFWGFIASLDHLLVLTYHRLFCFGVCLAPIFDFSTILVNLSCECSQHFLLYLNAQMVEVSDSIGLQWHVSCFDILATFLNLN